MNNPADFSHPRIVTVSARKNQVSKKTTLKIRKRHNFSTTEILKQAQ